MATFDIKEFLTHPTVDRLQGVTITKDQWKILAFHYGVTYSSKATKLEIQEAVLEHLAKIEVIPPDIPIGNLARASSNSSLSEDEGSLQALDYRLKISESERSKMEAERAKIEAENEKLKLELELTIFHRDNPSFTPRDNNRPLPFDLSKNCFE